MSKYKKRGFTVVLPNSLDNILKSNIRVDPYAHYVNTFENLNIKNIELFLLKKVNDKLYKYISGNIPLLNRMQNIKTLTSTHIRLIKPLLFDECDDMCIYKMLGSIEEHFHYNIKFKDFKHINNVNVIIKLIN